MPLRVKHNVLVQISADIDAKLKRFFPDTKEVIIDAFDRQAQSDLSVAPATTENLSFGDVTDVRGIYLELNAAGKVLLNGGTEEIPIDPAPSSAVAKFFLEGTLSQVQVKNEDAVNALVGVYVIWGSPTP